MSAPLLGLTAMPGVGDDERFTLLRDDAGMAVTLMRGAAGADVSYPGTFHIGFIQPTADAVDVINQRMARDGHDVRPPKHLHGSWTLETPVGEGAVAQPRYRHGDPAAVEGLEGADRFVAPSAYRRSGPAGLLVVLVTIV